MTTFDDGPIESAASRRTEGAFAAGGLSCAVTAWSLSGTRQNELSLPRHHFVSFQELHHGDYLVERGAFDGKRYPSRVLSERDSFFLPQGHRWIGTCRGNGKARILVCDLEHSVFALALGDQVRGFDLEPYLGPSPIASGLLERLEALCLTPDAFPRAYADALTAVLAFELFRARTTKPFPPLFNSRVGTSRFKLVVDRIEETLESDPGLSDLAALMGLSVSHFSHAFAAAYGVAPHRYIMRRRIDRAKALLRTSDATVATISARVGFSSQSRFTPVFARQTGTTPSAYRLQQQR
jgi:AraC family transcriptional regulator